MLANLLFMTIGFAFFLTLVSPDLDPLSFSSRRHYVCNFLISVSVKQNSDVTARASL